MNIQLLFKPFNAAALFLFILIFWYLQEKFLFTSMEKSPALKLIHSEQDQCRKIQNSIFLDHQKAKKVIADFYRLLPRWYYMEIHDHSNSDTDIPIGPERLNMLGPLGPSCKTKLESYGIGDDEKKACGLSKLVQMEKDMIENYECVIYSIGSYNQWGFEEAIFTKTNCRVETFDCTVDETVTPPQAIASRVRLHRVCLGNENNGLFKTWRKLHELTGITSAPTFLKIDIEGYEYPAMQIMIDEGYFLPLQIAMEIHTENRLEPPGPVRSGRQVNSAEIFFFMNYLHQFGGYYLIDRNDNAFCIHCSEILLAKLDCENHPVMENTYQALKTQPHKIFAKTVQKVLHSKYYS